MSKKEIINVGVIGIGPVGTILSVHLQEAGCEVALCDMDKIKVDLIRTNGIILEGVINKKTSFKNIFSNISDFKNFCPDFLFVCLKAPHLFTAVKEIEKLGDVSMGVICAMNGIDTEQIISKVIGKSRVFRMVINFAGNLTENSVTKVTFFNPPNYIASADDTKKAEAEKISELLNNVSLETKPVTSYELQKHIWGKTILNSSLSALCGIGRMTMKEAMSNPYTADLVEKIIEEAIRVAAAEKIKFEDDFIHQCMNYLKKAGDHLPSLAVDLLNNRSTEIDFMNGKFVEYGRKHCILTPLNLAFTNMVKAMEEKQKPSPSPAFLRRSPQRNSSESRGPKERGAVRENPSLREVPIPIGIRMGCGTGLHFLGVDLGSIYTKFSVIDEQNKIVFLTSAPTLNRDKMTVHHVIESLKKEYPIAHTCATGYGRKHFQKADLVKTELNCAALGVSKFFSGTKNIIDIGGEDIKVVKCDVQNNIENFYLNDKCAAGTGSFITEIAERAGIRIEDMSALVQKSTFNKELNSFCTVFAKTEIMTWLFEGMPVEDIAKGIYLSIVSRIMKLRIDPVFPVYLIGGVIAHHPFLKNLLQEKFKKEVVVPEHPKFIISFGAALMAKEAFALTKKDEKQVSPKEENINL